MSVAGGGEPDAPGEAGVARRALREGMAALSGIGRNPGTGGYSRFAWSAEDLACRRWFAGAARRRGLVLDEDGNGNVWGWWEPEAGAGDRAGVVTGSHLDSVPDGGAYDGPLGVVSGLAALDVLRARGFRPRRPLAVAVFAEEEGGRFGLACLGSRLLTGVVEAERARALTDAGGTSLSQAMSDAGADPDRLGADPRRLGRIGAFVELHIEQGRALADLGAPVGLASGIWPHGRWRLELRGQPNHAGTTRLEDRRDPMIPFSEAVLAARDAAGKHQALATFGRVTVEPNGTNGVPSRVTAWLDARAPDTQTLTRVVGEVERVARSTARSHGVEVAVACESETPGVTFDTALAGRLGSRLGREAGAPGGVPVLETGAGHDAGVLAGSVPAAMLFVRNPTGVSHSPAEEAGEDDCVAGVLALAAALEELAQG